MTQIAIPVTNMSTGKYMNIFVASISLTHSLSDPNAVFIINMQIVLKSVQVIRSSRRFISTHEQQGTQDGNWNTKEFMKWVSEHCVTNTLAPKANKVKHQFTI